MSAKSVEKKSTGIKGGARPGAGRKKGVPNKKTAETVKAVEESGLTPLEYMLSIMRGQHPKGAEPAQIIAWEAMRFEAAKAAAPYVHARLASVEHAGKDGGAIQHEHGITKIVREIVRASASNPGKV